MTDLEFGCLATAIGSMPHTSPQAACETVRRCLKDIPCWPQLPRRSFLENMYAQYSQGFPGVVISGERIYVDRTKDLHNPLERLYTAYLANDVAKYPITREYAAGLHACLDIKMELAPRAVKGQIVGPITWGAAVSDSEQRAVIYDDTLSDAAAKLLRLKAGWQEKELREISRRTIIFVDEPFMASFGSAYFALSKEKAVSLLEEVLGGISGVKGVHCCGNTDWSVLLGTSTDIISYDAYNYGQSLGLYLADVKRFLSQKKAIAWGIVPNDAEVLAKESIPSLRERLEETAAPFTRDGIPFRQLLRQSLLTPSCGLASLSEEGAARALELLADLSADLRQRYL